MPFPADLTLVTVAIQCDLPPDGGSTGTARFTSPVPLLGPTAGSIVPPFTVTATLAADGSATVELPATNDPQWTPQDWSYAVRVQAGSQDFRGSLQLDYQTTSVQLADLLQVDGAAESGVTYATLAQLNAVDDRIDDLGISDISGLQGQLDAKAPLASPTFTGTVSGITAAMVGLGSVDNTADVDKPVSTATQTALNLKAPLVSPTFTGTVSGISKAMVGLGNVDNAFDPMPGPLDHGLIGWTFDPIDQQAGTVVPTAGLAHVVRIRALGSVVTNIHFHLTGGGSALTAGQCFAALYNDAGALLGAGAVTADQSTAWATSGAKTMPLSTPQAVTAGAWYKVLWWFNGTTGPSLSRNTNAGSTMLNIGLTASTARYATADSGLTSAAPSNIGATSGGSTAWWVGLS